MINEVKLRLWLYVEDRNRPKFFRLQTRRRRDWNREAVHIFKADRQMDVALNRKLTDDLKIDGKAEKPRQDRIAL
ncbi:hypothetical protein NKH61_27725 [Mesorhizobium sp. M1005]|uniref:hypothetical protein n=1 Tax=unclassified Mesorhizobium TaxID=325217 RepID=UPI00333C1C3C